MHVLRRLTEGNESRWADLLPVTQMAINTQIVGFHHSKPFEVMFGRAATPLANFSDFPFNSAEDRQLDLLRWKIDRVVDR